MQSMEISEIIKKFGDDYLVTPDTFHMGIHQDLARNVAARFKGYDRVLDTCTGVGFMTIPLARVAKEVIAVDINHVHLEMAKENAKRAGLSNVTFILGDITNPETLKKIGEIDGAFLDPDWAK